MMLIFIRLYIWNLKDLVDATVSLNISNGENKCDKLSSISYDYNVPVSQIAFVGDDVQDFEIMQRVGYAFCPEDAIPEIKKISCVLPVKGGDGVSAHLFDYVKNSIN